MVYEVDPACAHGSEVRTNTKLNADIVEKSTEG